MSGEQQLERSVLEGKERDELHAIAEALGPFASQCPGSAAKRSRQRELQKKYVVPAWSNVPPRGARGSTFMPQTGSVASCSSPGRASVIRAPS